jgi:hypothetical protein
MTLRTTPRPSPCAGRVPGDWSGLSRARLDPAGDLPWEALPAVSTTASAPAARRPNTDPRPPCRRDRTPDPVVLPGSAFNPHSGSPAPRFCPTDL